MNEILETLKEIAKPRFKSKAEAMTADTNILKDLGADSLDLVELLMDVEARWDITFDDSDVAEIDTVGDLVYAIQKRIG